MEVLRKYFPLSFKEKNEISSLLIDVLLYLAGALVAGIIMGIFSGIPVLNWLFGIVGILVEIYVVSGIVLAALDYVKNKK